MAFGHQSNPTYQKAKRAVKKRGPEATLTTRRIVTGPKKGKPISPTAAYGYVNKGSVSDAQKDAIKGNLRYSQDSVRTLKGKGYRPPGPVSERASGDDRIAEDDPRWNAKTMGNRKGYTKPKKWRPGLQRGKGQGNFRI